jgi:hypothetical protein
MRIMPCGRHTDQAFGLAVQRASAAQLHKLTARQHPQTKSTVAHAQ